MEHTFTIALVAFKVRLFAQEGNGFIELGPQLLNDVHCLSSA